MPLFDTTLRNTRAGEKPQKLSDGGGLYLLVKTTGKKFWHMAYRFEGKQKLLSFGQYPEISLSRYGNVPRGISCGAGRPDAPAKRLFQKNFPEYKKTLANPGQII